MSPYLKRGQTEERSLMLSQESHGMEKQQDKGLPPYKEHSLKISESFKDEMRKEHQGDSFGLNVLLQLC